MSKITKLTPEQEADMEIHTQQWLEIGLCTDRIDQDKSIEAVKLMYECAGLDTPTKFIFCDGPESGFRQAKDMGGNLSNAIFGSQDASWIAFYDFFNKHFGIAKEVAGLAAVAKSCGWVWTFEETAIITDRPVICKFDEEKRLHNEHGPAVSYLDGFEIYSWHGTTIPKEWITEGVDAQTAITWENIEQRRCACEILGWANIIKALGGVIINEDVDPYIGSLIEVDIPDIGKERFLRVLCGTSREFAIPVPPELQTALAAQAWMVGLDESDFNMPEFRT